MKTKPNNHRILTFTIRLRACFNGLLAAAALILMAAPQALAAPPDLTSGGVPTSTVTINLGPTGMRGWVYYYNQKPVIQADTSASRQIQVQIVDAGSPADGILAPNDVILGADGTGATPGNFSSDARKSLAYAIADAEARTPATLKLLVWRAGTTSTKTLTLRTMGAYSATAPYNCPKSAKILEEGLQYIMANETSGVLSLGTLSLLAANDPANPNNSARMARAQSEARALIPSAADMTKMMSDTRDTGNPWYRGYNLLLLCEYYNVTQDAQVLPAIRANAVSFAKNQSLFGTVGHAYADHWQDGSLNGPMRRGYGPMNATALPAFLGLLLAKQCGITDPEIDPAIERCSRFLAYYANKGAIPYGEHTPETTCHDNNGKASLAALAFDLQPNRTNEARFFTKMAAASASEREVGHPGPFFSYLWAPLGAAAGGQAAASEYFSKTSWMLDLNRKWNGGFDYDSLNGDVGANSGNQFALNFDTGFRMSTAALLTYALPLRQLYITGRGQDPARWLTSTELADALSVEGYTATNRSTSQLVSDLGSWSPKVQSDAAAQLATLTLDSATINQISALATDPNGTSRPAACLALGKINDPASATARAATLASLLTDSQNHVRYMAAEGMRCLPKPNAITQLNTILSATSSTATPLFPMIEEDPLHMAHGRLGLLLFNGSSTYGQLGLIYAGGVTTAPKNLLYPAIKAVAANPIGVCRSSLGSIYGYLTQDDLNAVAGAVVDSVRETSPADRMTSGGVRIGGVQLLQKYKIAEGVPVALAAMKDNDALNEQVLASLKLYAGSCNTVTPAVDDLDAFCYNLISEGKNTTSAQALIDAIAADTNPATLIPFKSILSVTADQPNLTLPAKWTVLRATTNDYAEGASVYTWRKVYGAGDVSFTPNATTDSKNTTVLFNGTPGKYLFEVKMSDSRGLTEVTSTIAVTLYQSGGTLPSNGQPVANSQSPNIAQGIATPVTLTGSDPEGLALSFSLLTMPTHGKLTGTAPYLVYTSDFSYYGSDSITFKVTDSEGQTSTGTVYINVTPNNAVPTSIYEPFNYAVGSLNGATGSSEAGFSGPWSSNSNGNVVSGSLAYANLPTAGGSIGGSSSAGGSRTISSSALAATGLLNDGATLWFSAVVGYQAGINTANSRLTLALANSSFSTGYAFYINNQGPLLGSGLGLTLGRFDRDGRCVATQFRDSSFGTSAWSGNVFGPVPMTYIGAGQQRMVVGKFTWGAASDTIELYEPDPKLNLGTVKSSLTVNVDQSTFNTITFNQLGGNTLDEIRFGPTYASVLNGSAPMTADTTAPTPSTAAFLQLPKVTGTSSISMAAMTAYDPNSVEYYFTCTAGGGHDSGWQDSISYTDTGLTPGTLYSYTVKARDKSPAHNQTTPSPAASATISTQASVPPVIGMIQTSAQSIITNAGLQVGTITTTNDAHTFAGTVLGQTPSSGTVTSLNTAVNLVVSLGPVPDSTPPSIASTSFVDDKGGAAVLINTPVNYTLTFSEDIDGSTVNSADFGNAGTSTANIGSIVKTGSGVFTVQVTPTSLGTLQLQINAGSLIKDMSGNALVTASVIVDDTTITVNPILSTGAVIYEPFNMTVGPLKDQPAGFGLSGKWQRYAGIDTSQFVVTSPGMSYGTLPVLGNQIQNSGTAGGGRANSALFSSQLVNRGLLADGATLWFSLLVQPVTNVNTSASVVLASATSGGNSVGIYLAGGHDLQYYATKTGVTGTYLGVTAQAALENVGGTGQGWNPHLVVGKIVWGTGGSNSTFELFMPDSSLNMGARKGAVQFINFDQRTLNQLDISNSGGGIEFDEIRVGPSYTSVIGGGNTPPVWSGNPLTLANAVEDAAYGASIAGNATDTDLGAILTFAKVSGPAWLNVATDGTLSGTPGNGDVGANSFTISMTDGLSAPLTTTLNITVNNTNDIPVWTSNPIAGANATEDSSYSSTLAGIATDVDLGTILTYAKLSGPAWLTVASNGALSGTPTNSDVGANNFVVSVSDGVAPAITTTLAITVINTNDAPTWSANPMAGSNATEDTAYSGNIASNASDVDQGAVLTFVKVSGPAWLNVASNGTLSGTPGNSDAGANSFTVGVSDGIAAAVTTTLNITVINVNDPPTWSGNPITGANGTQGTAYSGTLAGLASDIDAGSSLTFAKVSGPAWLSVAANGALSGTPANSDVGAGSFTVSVSDGIAPAVTATLNITVINVNDSPTWNSNPITATPAATGQAYTGSLAGLATDVDTGASLTFAKVSGPAWLSVAANGTLSGTPATTDSGSNVFTVSVSDGIAAAVQATLNINVVLSYFWDGGTSNILTNGDGASAGGNGTWNTTIQNWDVGASAHATWDNAANNIAVFGGTAGTVTVGTSMSVGSIQFLTANYTLSGGSLSLGSSVTFANSVNATVSSVISGSGSLTKTGAGTLTLSGANTFTGPVNVSAGVLSINSIVNGGSASALGQSTSAASNLLLGNGATLTYTGAAASTDRSFTINGTATGQGATLNPTGTGALNLNSTAAIGYGSPNQTRTLTLSGINNSALTHTLAAQITDNGTGAVSLIKNVGNGWWLTNPNNSFTGGVKFSRGFLVFSTGALGTSGQIAVDANSAPPFGLRWAPGNTDDISSRFNSTANAGLVTLDTGTNDVVFASAISQNTNSWVCKDGTGSLTLNAASTWGSGAGATLINAGTWVAKVLANGGVASSVGAPPSSAARLGLHGGTVKYTGTGATIDRNFHLSASGSLDASGTGPLVLSQTGVVSPTAVTRTGNISLNSRSVPSINSITSDLVPGMKVSGPGIPAGSTITSVDNAGQITISVNATATTTGGALTFGNYSPGTPITLTLTGSNTGANEIKGILQDSASGISGDSSKTVMNVTKTGAGKWVLSGANTYTGATTVSQGTLALTGGSQASPITVASGASLEFTLGSPVSSTSSVNLTAGTVKIVGTPSLLSYTLMTASGGFTGTPVLNTPITRYELVVQGNQLQLNKSNHASAWSNNPVSEGDATEDSAYTASLGDNTTDADGDPLTYTKLSGPAWLSVAADGSLSGTPSNSDVGVNSLTVSVNDGIAAAVTTTVYIVVINTNDAPTWTVNPVNAPNATEDSVYNLNLASNAFDVDPGASLMFSKVSGPAWLNVATDGTVSGTPTNSDVGANSFTVAVSDGIAAAVTATLNLTVINTNDAPIWTGNPVTTADATEDSAYSATLAGSAADVDIGATLTFAKVGGPAWLSVAANGILSGTPVNSDVGVNSFMVSVSDGIAAPVTTTLRITVINTNDAPTWSGNPVNGADATEDSVYSGSLAGSAADVDVGATLTFAKVTGPAWLSVAANGSLSGTPTNSDVGSNEFTVSVSDGIAVPVTTTLHLTVINTNDAPTWSGNPIAATDATEDSAYTGSIASSATDVDAGATLTFAKVSGPAWLSVAANGALSGTPVNSDVGANSFIVSVSDGIAAPVTTTLNITVINTNDAPTWAGDPVSGTDATEDAVYSVSLAASASDVDAGATLTFAKVSGPAWLSVASNGSLSGAPANSDVGVNTFTVSVSDGIATPVTATLNITVINTNDAPTWTSTPITGAGATTGTAYNGSLAGLATDVDTGASLTYAKVSGPAWLNVATDGTLSGTPVNVDTGNNVFTVSVSDGIATPVQATLNITVALASPITVYWDGGTSNILTNGDGASGGTSGTWNSTLQNWDVGATAHVAWDNTAANTAVFGATAGTVTLGSTMFVGGAQFLTTNYTLSGGSLNLVSAATFTNNVTATVASVITGNGSITKAGTGTLTLSGTNTFVGPVNITGGTLAFATIANGGSASALGQSSSAASNLLLGNGTTLSYTGPAASSDRSFTINGTAAGHAATVNANGSGALNLTSTAAIAYGVPNQTRSLTLTGVNNSALTHTLAAQITDNGTGAVTLYKSGASNWWLTNPNNSFTGGVRFNKGFLVFSSGALGTSGTIGFDSNAASPFGLRWAPGNTDDISARFNGATTANNGYGTLDTGANDVVFANGISPGKNPSWIIKEGIGSLTMNGINVWGSATGGATLINAGTLGVKYISNGGVNDSIGGVQSSATCLGLRGCTLKYIGTGSTNDHNFHLSGDNTIDASGSGALVFSQTGLISPTPAARSFGITSGSKSTGNASVYSSDLVPGMVVSGTGIPVGTKIVSVGTNGVLTFDQNATATTTTTLSFGSYLPGSLTLTGTNTGANEIKGILSDSVSTISPYPRSVLAINKTGAGQWILSGANTYTGVTTLSGGTLSLSSISVVANANPLGQSSSAASNLLLGDGSTLRFTGAAATCDRLFTLNTTANSGVVTLDASGTGAVNFSNSGSVAYGAATVGKTRTLVLTGSNTGGNTLAALVADNGVSPVAVTKAGTGKWVLSNNNTYSGDTTVNAGTLQLVGLNTANDGSAIYITSGATLDLNFSGNETVARLYIDGTQLSPGVYGPGNIMIPQITGTGTLTVALPLPWVTADIGTGMLPGFSAYSAGTFTQGGSGIIGSTADKLHFTYQMLSGDGEIIARISTLQDTGSASRVGVMIRDSLATNSQQILMGLSAAGSYVWDQRTATAGTTTSTASGSGGVPNAWVRLVRSGTAITAYTSADGITWTTVGSTTGTNFGANCYIGLAVGSGSDGTLNTSQFNNVSVIP